jgi:predicted transcriptional regulator
MKNARVKVEARRLVEELPENATWDDLMYRIYVRQAIEAGFEDSEAGRIVSVEEVRARFGLAPVVHATS